MSHCWPLRVFVPISLLAFVVGSALVGAAAFLLMPSRAVAIDRRLEELTTGRIRDERPGAGTGPAQSPGAPWWTTYISVEDADQTAKVVQDLGGQVLVEPMDVGTFGRMAVLADPMGAQFSVWQPIQHIGAGVVNEHGTLTWNELHTRDRDRAKDFYSKVFGWYSSDVDMGQGFTYTVVKLTEDENDQGIGGITPHMGEDQSGPGEWNGPDDQGHGPDRWKVYFAVDDADATAAKATELGGGVTMPPTTMAGVGRFAALTGPPGEGILIITNMPAAQG